MALSEYNIPEGVMWADYFETDSFSSRTPEYDAPESEDGGEWVTVGAPVLKRTEAITPARWCRDGNACVWRNCKFRHERCSYYDNWVRRGKSGVNCRCYEADPKSCRKPEDGGCMYDHRDHSKLKVFVETLPCSNESEMWDSFFELGLEGCIYNVYDMAGMSKANVSLLIRSVTAAKVEVAIFKKKIQIFFEED
jgi:hypothetical protein